jgi:hypothetical protein
MFSLEDARMHLVGIRIRFAFGGVIGCEKVAFEEMVATQTGCESVVWRVATVPTSDWLHKS